MPAGEVYVDLYFFVNASMDLLCLNLTALMLHSKPRRWRLLLGAAAGGLFSVAVLLLGIGGFWELFCDALGACGICAVVFARKGAKFWQGARTVGAFFVISVLLGGFMTALFWALNRLNLPLDALTEDHISVWLFALLALVSGLLTRKGGKLLGRANKASAVLVEAVLFGKPVSFRALVDTGNLLCEPVSGRPVILCDPAKLRGILPPELLAPQADISNLRPPELARRLRLIPASGATGERLLIAVVPDRVLLSDLKKSRAGKRETNHLIAPVPLGDRAAGFDALIGN